ERRDLGRSRLAAERHALDDPGMRPGTTEKTDRRRVERRIDPARADRVDSDVVAGEFPRQGIGEGYRRALRRRIAGETRATALSGKRRKVDDRSFAGAAKVGHGIFRAEELGADIDREQPVPAGDIEIRDGAGVLQAGILAKHVEAAEPGDAILDECADVTF